MRFRITAALLIAATATGVVLELLSPSVAAWFGSHQFSTSLLVEALLLLAVYLVVDRHLQRRNVRAWKLIAIPLIADLWELAEGLAGALEAFARVDQRAVNDRQYQMIETLALTYRDILSGLYPVLTVTPELAHMLPVAKRVGERARYAAVELNIDMETDGKLYADFLEAYDQLGRERARLLDAA